MQVELGINFHLHRNGESNSTQRLSLTKNIYLRKCLVREQRLRELWRAEKIKWGHYIQFYLIV